MREKWQETRTVAIVARRQRTGEGEGMFKGNKRGTCRNVDLRLMILIIVTMTGKRSNLVDMMERRKVDIL